MYLVQLKVTHAVNQPSLIVRQNKGRSFLSCLSLRKTHQLPAGYSFSLFLIFPYLLFSISHPKYPLYFNISPTAYLICQYITQNLPYISVYFRNHTTEDLSTIKPRTSKPYNRGPINQKPRTYKSNNGGSTNQTTEDL